MASRCSLPVSHGNGLVPSSFISVEYPRRNRIASHMTNPCSTPQKPPNGLSSSPAMYSSHFPWILPTYIFHAFGYYLVAEGCEVVVRRWLVFPQQLMLSFFLNTLVICRPSEKCPAKILCHCWHWIIFLLFTSKSVLHFYEARPLSDKWTQTLVSVL